MKVLIVNSSDIEGGAARAAYRLHQALLGEGVSSKMLVQSKVSDDFTVVGPTSKFQNGIGKMSPTLDAIPARQYKARNDVLFSPGWLPLRGMADKINALNPDVVHFHWIAGGMMRIEEISKIAAPIVWSLHDMWPFTGGCHYDEGCEKYTESCGSCPILASDHERDLSRKVWRRKRAIYSRLDNLTIVGLSKWLMQCAENSSLFESARVVNLPNPIDTEKFAPFDTIEARRLLNLPASKKLILFGAMSATSDPRKGFRELSEALAHLSDDYELVVFGSSEPKCSQGFKQSAHYLGQLHDDASLRALYSAADVMIVPSIQENLSNAIMEALACATPVVGFSVGGNSDLIEHKWNGYLAENIDPIELARGIDWVLNHDNYKDLQNNAREKVNRDFERSLVAKKYIELYQKVTS
jgi:glycosyltransferase involved in cell wall biosynthesis